MEDPEIAINRALETYLKKGYSEAWVNQRLKSIEIRKGLTDEWDRGGIKKGLEYAILTDEITKAWAGITTKEYKKLKNLKKENLRDNMTNMELVLNMLAEESFAQLRTGILNFINKYNYESFVLTIKSLGFISNRLLNSMMTLDFAYNLFLLLNSSNEIPKIEIKRYVQKWFLLSTLTSRYITSPESQMDRDIRAIQSKGFKQFFEENEEAQLSETFWNVGLVQNLETSSITSPYFNTYIAAQIFNGERSLLSNSSKVSDLITTMGDVHHIFPKEYLKQNGITDKSTYNQVANFAYLDKAVNISIGKQAPCEYFKDAKLQCENGEVKIGTITDIQSYYNNLQLNCIPQNIDEMDYNNYQEFLSERRKMMANKIKNFYYSL